MWYFEVAGALVIILILLLVLRSMQKSRKTQTHDGQTEVAPVPEVESPIEMVTQEPTHEHREDERASLHAQTAEPISWFNDVVPEQVPPLVLQDLDEAETDFHLNEDHVVRMSSYETPHTTFEDEDDDEVIEASDWLAEPSSEHVAMAVPDERQQWLQSNLDMPGVLGWFTLTAFGEVRYFDQPYADEVHHHFAKLLEQMIAASELVGMADWKEFVLRGEEGVILMMTAPQSVMAQGDYLVVFLDEEKTVSNVIAQMGQVS
jgi:hypothetical protein